MNFNQLEYLKELIHSGSFTRAADRLGITQPALSTQIKLLEEDVDFIIVDRKKRPIELTKDGQAYYDLALEILDRVDLLRELPGSLTDQVSGTLRIGIIPTLAPYLVSLFIDELGEKYPDLEILIEELITETIVSDLRSGHLDAGIISTPIEIKSLHQEVLFYERFFLYVSDKHEMYTEESIFLEEIDKEDIWYLREGNCFTNQVNAICSLAGKKKVFQNLTYFSHSIESLRRIVENKRGITFIPELATIQIPIEYEDMIKSFAGKQPAREISLLTTSNITKPRQIEAFTEVLLSQLPKHMKNKPSDWIVDTKLKF